MCLVSSSCGRGEQQTSTRPQWGEKSLSGRSQQFGRPRIHEFPVSQVKVARLPLSSRSLSQELPPRQGVWVYFLDQDLGCIRGQLTSTFLQCGGFNVGSGPPKHSQLYFWELSLLPLRGHPQPDFNGTLEGPMEIVSVIPSLPYKAPLCKHSWRKYSNKKNNSSTCYQWYRK